MRCACLQQRGGSLKHLPKHPLKKELKVTVSGIAINILDSWSQIRAKALLERIGRIERVSSTKMP